jgi:predicted nucleotidyltransferase
MVIDILANRFLLSKLICYTYRTKSHLPRRFLMLDLNRLSKNQILTALNDALEPLDYTYACWEGGAAAFGRVDEWSDLDILVDVADEHVQDTLQVIEETLTKLSPIEVKYEVPQPSWHGHSQVFYRMQDTSKFLLIDLVVIKHSNPNKFLQPELHGKAIIYFDKSDVIQNRPLNQQELALKLKDRLEALKVSFDLFQILTIKELYRGNLIEALNFYHNFTLRPLVEVLRIPHEPTRHSFYTRYIYYDMPAEVLERLESLYFIADGDDLWAKRQIAEDWFYETIDQIGLE